MPLSNDAPGDDLLRRLLDVHAAVDDHRHVAGTDAVGRLAGGVGGLHHRAAASGHHHVYHLHQLLGGFHRAVLDRLHQVVGPAVRLHDLHELVGQVHGALLGLRMRREDHGVAGLEREHAVAHRRHDRVGDRRHGADDADRLGDVDELHLFVFADDAAGLLVLEVVPDRPRLALVLEDLVLVDADAGLVHGHARQRFGVVVDVLADALDDGVHLLLREAFEDGLGRTGLGHQLLDLGVGGGLGLLGAGAGAGAHEVPRWRFWRRSTLNCTPWPITGSRSCAASTSARPSASRWPTCARLSRASDIRMSRRCSTAETSSSASPRGRRRRPPQPSNRPWRSASACPPP